MAKHLTKAQVLDKLQKYCIYQDRCHTEVRTKLLQLQVYGDELEEMMSKLIEDGFLNEERYAIAYASGKFRINHWGKRKIMLGLKSKHISDYCIQKALQKIDQKEYNETIANLSQKKAASLSELDDFHKNQRVFQYLWGKGYTYEDILPFINTPSTPC
jgi:regulatory protein